MSAFMLPPNEFAADAINSRFMITPGALKSFTRAEIDDAVTRHLALDWSDMDKEDQASNLAAAMEGNARVFSAYISEIEKGVDSPFGDTSQVAFGEQIVEFECAGWVEDVAWSPSGDSLCFVGHDSSVSFVSFPGGNPVCQTVKSKDLPNCKCLYLSNDVVVCGGHSFNPEVYQRKGGQWQLVGNVDSKAKNSGVAKAAATNFSAARSLWNNKTTRGQDDNAGADDIWTCHQNAIMDLKAYSDAQQKKVTSFSTSALDGRVVVWDSADLQGIVSL